MVSATDPNGRNFDFLDRSRYCFFQVLSCPHEAESTPFQTHRMEATAPLAASEYDNGLFHSA
jgi:hypothetical protein